MYKYKIVIADDEAVIRNNLSSLLSDRVPALDKPVLCANGEQVINILKKSNVDIVVSDIRMPQITGLDVAKYIHEHKLNTKIILISGFSEFKYAHEALEYGVSKYILKPIDFNEIISAVTEAINRLHTDMTEACTVALTELHMREIIRRYLSLYMYGVIPFKKLAPLNYTPLSRGTAGICAVADISLPENESNAFLNGYYDSIWIDTFEMCNNNLDCFCLNESDLNAKLLIITDTTDEKTAVGLVEDHLKECNKLMLHAYKCEFNAVVEYFPSLENINLLDFKELANNFVNNLTCHNSIGNEDMLKVIYLSMPRANLQQFLSCIMNILEKEYAFFADNLKDEIKKIETLEDAVEFSGRLNDELHSSANNNFIVEKVIQYINSFYSDKTLDFNSVANKFNFNRSYLSRVFKQKIGQNPSEYLTSVRLEKSKALLKSNKYTIKQVARSVGYADEGYFGQAFKRAYGVTPSKYMRMQEK